MSSKTLSHSERYKRSKQTSQISIKMKLSFLLLLLLSFVWAEPNHIYNGFDSCHSEGWFCDPISGSPGYEITYDCNRTENKNTRIWIWTARLPNHSKKLKVMNCDTVEVHADCTRYERNTAILQFSVINVETLVILEPSSGELHDNLPITQFPPTLYLENVRQTSFYSGLFHNNVYSCYYVQKLQKMILKRVGIKNIPSNSFFTDIEQLHWSQVKVDNIDQNAIKINGSVTIEDSHFNTLPTNAMTFSGKDIIFKRNSISNVLPQAISVFSSEFHLTNNSINEIMALGLSVRSSHVKIDGNVIKYLGKEALEGIGPSFYLLESAYSVSYVFTRNTIEGLSPFSLHNNWTGYENTCSTIKLDSNQFDCSCYNIIWLGAYLNDEKKLPNAGFYKILLNTTHHCGTSYNCSLSSIVPYACHNDTSITKNCLGFQEKENFTYLLKTTELNIEVRTEITKEDFKNWNWDKSKQRDNDILYDSDKQDIVLGDTYYKDNGNELRATKSNFPIWIIVLIFVFLATLNVLAYVVFYLRKRRRNSSMDVCKYEKRGDSDTLIIKARNDGMNIECENISYQE